MGSTLGAKLERNQRVVLREGFVMLSKTQCHSLARLNHFIGDNNIYAAFKIDKGLKRSVPTESLLFVVQGAHEDL